MLQRQHIAEFIKARYEALYPNSSTVEFVRFVFVIHESGDQLAQERGHWRTKPLDSVDPPLWHGLSVHFFDGRLPLNSRGQSVVLRGKEK